MKESSANYHALPDEPGTKEGAEGYKPPSAEGNVQERDSIMSPFYSIKTAQQEKQAHQESRVELNPVDGDVAAQKSEALPRSTTLSEIHRTATTKVLDMITKSDKQALGQQFAEFYQHLDPTDQFLVQMSAHLTSKLGKNEWNVKHTLSYWVAICFIFGSLVFTSGSIFWLFELNHAQELALVGWPFFTGAIAFSTGSYIGYWEVINYTRPDGEGDSKTLWFSFKNRTVSWWATFSFVCGTTCYFPNTLCGTGLFALPESMVLFPWWWALAGGFFFTTGGLFEMINHKFWRPRFRKTGWWVSWGNGIGGVLFFVASIFGIAMEGQEKDSDAHKMNALACKWSYIIGSASYLIAACFSLKMWKMEQFGLAFMPEMNLVNVTHNHNTVQIHQLPFLFMYNVTIAVAVSLTILSYCREKDPALLSNALLACVIPMGILLLGSVIHRVPEEPPYSYLLWFLRMIMFWFTINLIVNVKEIVNDDMVHCVG